MRAALLVVAGLALAGYIGMFFMTPSMADAQAREAAQALIAGAEPAKQQVAAAAEKSGSLAGAGNGVNLAEKNDPKHGRMRWIAAENGVIRGWNPKHTLEITLTPALQGGKASWSCRGYPVGAMPASCGGKG